MSERIACHRQCIVGVEAADKSGTTVLHKAVQGGGVDSCVRDRG